ncbi:MAG: LPS export ABC transporter periplasmic protein LptC [Candidatus Omnitrophota bacterium]|nr:MAG: LPS export ABC transporter periplasmic protein LptC [Candidatus Omnitrophota bacterium]
MKKFLLIILAVLLIIVFVKSRKPADTPKDADIVSEQVPKEENTAQGVQSFSISGTSEDGKNRWQVEGESADIFSDVVNMRTIEAKSDSAETSVTLTADDGTFFKDSKDVELRKNVIVNTDEGTTLKTNRLKWLAEAENIITDEYVYIQRENMDVSGTGAKAVPDMKRVWLNQDVKMKIYPDKNIDSKSDNETSSMVKSPMIITCDGSLYVDYQNNISYFNKNVIVQDKDGKIFADKVIAYIDPERKRVYKTKALGNVKIVHKQNVSYSNKVIYLVDEGKAILVGRPKVVIYSVDKILEGKEAETGESL